MRSIILYCCLLILFLIGCRTDGLPKKSGLGNKPVVPFQPGSVKAIPSSNVITEYRSNVSQDKIDIEIDRDKIQGYDSFIVMVNNSKKSVQSFSINKIDIFNKNYRHAIESKGDSIDIYFCVFANKELSIYKVLNSMTSSNNRSIEHQSSNNDIYRECVEKIQSQHIDTKSYTTTKLSSNIHSIRVQ